MIDVTAISFKGPAGTILIQRDGEERPTVYRLRWIFIPAGAVAQIPENMDLAGAFPVQRWNPPPERSPIVPGLQHLAESICVQLFGRVHLRPLDLEGVVGQLWPLALSVNGLDVRNARTPPTPANSTADHREALR